MSSYHVNQVIFMYFCRALFTFNKYSEIWLHWRSVFMEQLDCAECDDVLDRVFLSFVHTEHNK